MAIRKDSPNPFKDHNQKTHDDHTDQSPLLTTKQQKY